MLNQTGLFFRAMMAVAAIGASGCSTMKQMAAAFEERWEDPDAILKEMKENEPLPDEQKEALEIRLTGLVQAGNCGEIESAANDVLSYNADHVPARFALADCELKARDLASAKTRFTSLYADTADMHALRGLGVIAVIDGRRDEGMTMLQDVIAHDSTDWRAWNALGYAEDLARNWDKAEEAYRMAAAADETQGGPLNNLGMSYIQQERYKDAAIALKTALARDPSLNVARLNLRIAQALSGDYAGALAGASEEDRAVVLNNIGVAAMSRGELEVAKKYFRQALNENPAFYAVAYENLERAQHLGAN